MNCPGGFYTFVYSDHQMSIDVCVYAYMFTRAQIIKSIDVCVYGYMFTRVYVYTLVYTNRNLS